MNKTNPIGLLTVLSFLVLLALPLSAQEKKDSVFTFRFKAGTDMFFVPAMNNGEELTRLFDCVDRYKEMITGREITLYVDGYSVSDGSGAENFDIAGRRSRRVKSELIGRKGLTEDCFITRNHVGQGNFVTVRFTVPEEDIEPKPQEKPNTAHVTEESVPVTESKPERDNAEAFDNSESDVAPVQSVAAQQPAVADTPDDMSMVKLRENFALKTNLLYYAFLMPNIEIEWMFANRWSAALEWQGAWWSKSTPRKVYRLSTVMPEVRYWAIDRSRWHGMYVGIFGGAGLYDLDNSKKGHEGEGAMVGFSVGYMWPISKHLSLDASLGAGYLRIRDKEYAPRDGHFLYHLTNNINYFGPLRAKLSLVWRIQSKKKNR